jgi:hypothetical protein
MPHHQRREHRIPERLDRNRDERGARDDGDPPQGKAFEDDEGDDDRQENTDQVGPAQQDSRACKQSRRHPPSSRAVQAPTGEQEAENSGRERRPRRDVREDVARVDQVVDAQPGHERRGRRQHTLVGQQQHRCEHRADKGRPEEEGDAVQSGLGRS